jgi:hypothetical protein
MTMRVKLVIMSKMAGARERTVRRMMSVMAAEKLSRRERSGSWGIFKGLGGGRGAGSGAATTGGGDIAVGASCAREILATTSGRSSASARKNSGAKLTRASFLIASL